MWAGGSIQWPGADPKHSTGSFLKVGESATEVTRVVSCEPKIIKKTGESMLVVGVVKEFLNSKGDVCVVDNRNWVFREALDPSKPGKPMTKPAEQSAADIQKTDEGKLVRQFRRETSELFRFSALTFNAHRIHYDKPWAIDVEGHRDTVVHGPLNMISILDFWRDSQKVEEIVYPKSLEYRATSPIYVEEAYRITMNADAASTSEVPVEVVSNDGTLCMKAKIIRW
jgi:hydroxyacyl-ACP dehydratase HTD2-like protein with hotdog domain